MEKESNPIVVGNMDYVSWGIFNDKEYFLLGKDYIAGHECYTVRSLETGEERCVPGSCFDKKIVKPFNPQEPFVTNM